MVQQTEKKPLITVQKIAYSVGFDACGVSPAGLLVDDVNRLNKWISNEMHGEMGYLERNIEKRLDPLQLVPNARSIISVLLSYFPGNPSVTIVPPKISRYALIVDYHAVIKAMLWELLDALRKEFGAINGRAFVDSAPVLERSWASKSGLGWIGKNSMLIHQKFGTYTFIGELVVDIEIESSKVRIPNRCGTCTRCIDSCPTGAIVEPYTVDARKCISYLTIEKKGLLSEQEKKKLNGWCFGCDICQEVCPWNKKIASALSPRIQPKQSLLKIGDNHEKELTEKEFAELFGDTSLSRMGYEKFIDTCKDQYINK